MILRSILFYLLIIGTVFAKEKIIKETDNFKSNINLELKLGVSPYNRIGNSYAENSKFSGVDQGIEIYNSFNNGYSIGFGGEVKGRLKMREVPYDNRIYAFYLLGKKDIGQEYSIIGRVGKTSVADYESTYYAGIGLEKRINRTTFQVLYEETELKANRYKKDYQMVSLKVGYVFGDLFKSKNSSTPTLEAKEESELIKIPESIQEFSLNDHVVIKGFNAYETTLTQKQKEQIDEFLKILKNAKNKGQIELKSYIDKTGSLKLNKKLSFERAKNVKEYIESKNLDEIKNLKINIFNQEIIYDMSELDLKDNRKIIANYYKDSDVNE